MTFVHWDDLHSEEQRRPSGFQAVLGGGTPIPQPVLIAPDLEIIQLVSAGYDRLDMSILNERNLLVCNNPGANAQAVAEHILMSLLYFAHRAGEAQAIIYGGQFTLARSCLMGPLLRDLSEMTLGIVGFGAIGQLFAQIAKPFGANLLYHSRSRNQVAETRLDITYSELDPLLKEADGIVVTLPLTSQTYHLFDSRRFAQMKETAIFINVGRGGVVDSYALTSALAEKRIYAASIDVFDPEPLPPDHPLLHVSTEVRERLLLTPHTAGLTHHAWRGMVQKAIDNLIRYAISGQPQHIVPSTKHTVFLKMQNESASRLDHPCDALERRGKFSARFNFESKWRIFP
ncbi:2-hydroxyacid dehydrogenase [Sulfoacidibacillus thermotolerans]|nr:2-hydroxyacid dehydrogenase [Sulfoacidibacillus thermotolerans]